MYSEKLHGRIQSLEKKIQQLLTRHRHLQNEIQELKKENAQLLARQLTNRASIASQDSVLGTNTTVQLKLKDWGAEIDSYIGNVDEIIAYLEHLHSP